MANALLEGLGTDRAHSGFDAEAVEVGGLGEIRRVLREKNVRIRAVARDLERLLREIDAALAVGALPRRVHELLGLVERVLLRVALAARAPAEEVGERAFELEGTWRRATVGGLLLRLGRLGGLALCHRRVVIPSDDLASKAWPRSQMNQDGLAERQDWRARVARRLGAQIALHLIHGVGGSVPATEFRTDRFSNTSRWSRASSF